MSALLEKYWYLILIALLLATIEVQHLTLVRADEAITKANDALTQWETTAKDQTAQIDQLQKDNVARQQKADAAIAQAQKTASIYQKRAMAIESQTLSGNQCQNLNTIITEYMKGYQP